MTKGDRVKPSELAINTGIWKFTKNRRGIITEIKSCYKVRVLWDGRVHPETVYMPYLEIEGARINLF